MAARRVLPMRSALALLGLVAGPAVPWSLAMAQAGEPPAAVQAIDPQGRPFRHAVHLRTIACGDCHLPEERHRATREWTPPDCAACHHAEPVVAGCTTCHDRRDLAGPRRHSTTLALSVWETPRARQLGFDHALHPKVGCLECHREGMERPPESCGACHEDHHRPDAGCAGCHAAPRAGVHDRSVHLGCGGAGCHAAEAGQVPRLSRTACLVCHEDRREHRPGAVCVQCHAVPMDSTFGSEDPAHGDTQRRP